MRRALLLATVLSAGCVGPGKAELWLFQIGTLSLECVDRIDENFIDASPPEDEAPDEDWTFTDDHVLSDRLVLGTVLHGRRGSRTLVLDGIAYPGQVEKGVTTFTWEGATDSANSQQHDAGYSYVQNLLSTSTSTITLQRDTETKEQSGTMEIVSVAGLGFTENDEWAFEAVGLPSGQIPAFLYLDGPGVANDPAQEDCTGPSCQLTVATDCSGSTSVQATWMGRTDNSGFGGLDDAEMPYGDGQSSLPATSTL